MKAVVLGTGIVGTAAVWDLARRGYDVVAADAVPAAVQAAAESTGSEPVIIDAADPEAVADLFAGASLVVSGVPYHFGPALAQAAVAAGAHYLDFGGNPAVVAAQRTLHDAAAATGVAVVPDCGLAPGLADVLAADLIGRLGGRADAVRLRVGALPQQPRGALGYQITFSPVGLINEYDAPCEVIRDGKLVARRPLTGLEELSWPGRGTLEAFHTAGGASSLARRFAGAVASLDYKTIRYPGHGAQMAALRELGLFDETPRTTEPAGVVPRQLMAALFAERLPRGEPDLVLVRITASRDDRTVRYEMEDVADDRFSALARTTAFPAIALADLIASGDIAAPGVHTMDEAAPAGALIDGIAALGISVRFTEE